VETFTALEAIIAADLTATAFVDVDAVAQPWCAVMNPAGTEASTW
jgi:hypothetical protein